MTGPTRNILSPDTPTSHLHSLPLDFDDATGEILASNTISLHDPATIWPSRSIERQRAFQHLLNRCITAMRNQCLNDADTQVRYSRQILYGCKNPRCDTPTCLSRQKRVAKGPFRPYTVLSTRTLATFLASQDHPERGLCPHQPVDPDPRPRSPVQDLKTAGKKPENRSSLTGSRSSHVNSTPRPASGVGFSPVQGQKIKVHIANGRIKSPGLIPETLRVGSSEGPKNNDDVRKEKDPKSFTQNLFDTIAMKLLHRANVSDSQPPWAPSNERAQLLSSSNPASNSLAPKTDGDISKKVGKDAEKPLIPDADSAKAAYGDGVLEIESVPDITPVLSNTASPWVVPARDGVLECIDPKKGLESSESLDEDGKAHLAANVEAKESTLNAATPPSGIPETVSPSKQLEVAKTTPLRTTSTSVASLSEHAPNLAAQSLSHFTSANITALREAKAVCRSDLHEQHCLLERLGRTDLLQHSSNCGSYGDFLAYSCQSMTYILSNVDALLQSFLHVDDSNTASKVVWAYGFAFIVDLFRKLRRIDMHPNKIFPSLWISAGRLYPVSSMSNSRRSLTASNRGSFSLDSFPASQDCSLNDLEACHTVKIMLAALVASVPKCSPMAWFAARKLHASGIVAPSINSLGEQKIFGKSMKILDAFEDEMALNLVIRLVRSIDIRYQLVRARTLAEDVGEYRRRIPPTFQRVVDYVNADELKIRVADNEGQPSVKSGDWIDPEVEQITWHPKEWAIIIEWLRTIILKEWDGKAKVAKGSAVGGALELMAHIRKQRISHLLSRVLS